jgi:transposase InsO family protein
MESTRSSAVVDELKRQFCVHGIPAEVISDNGPQYSSREFQEFEK